MGICSGEQMRRHLCSDDGPGLLQIDEKRGKHMLWTIAVILIILWALGLISSYTMGGFIHLLLVIAIVVVLLNIIQGRRRG